jgi:hypothetical protein
MLQPWKRLYRFSHFLLRDPKFIDALQLEPKLGARAKEMGESQRSVSRDSTLSVQYTCYAVRWDT